jgi:hypothetical protein
MLQQGIDYLGWLEDHVAYPEAKSSMRIHGFRPL